MHASTLRNAARRGAALAALAVAAACAAGPAPQADVRRAEKAVRLAEEAGVRHDESAIVYFMLAREELKRAYAAVARGANEDARGWAMRAEADADLALLIAREAGVRSAAQRTLEEARQLGEGLR